MNGNTVYIGARLDNGPDVRRISPVGLVSGLNWRADLVEYSRAFDWGNKGPGCHQLAIALLADVLGDELAGDFYEDFAAQVLAKLPNAWVLETEDVNGWFLGRTWVPTEELLIDLAAMEGGAI